MNSIIFDDRSREQLALETAKNLKELLENTQKVTVLHKELLEVNLSVTAYIEESKNRLEEFRRSLASNAKSSAEVIEILSEK